MATSNPQDFFAPPTQMAQLTEPLSHEEFIKRGMSLKDASRFIRVRERFLQKKPTQWSKIVPPEDDFDLCDEIPDIDQNEFLQCKKQLSELIILQFNGGTGIEMGYSGPKSAMALGKQIPQDSGKADDEFVDNPLSCILQHIHLTNKAWGVDIPLFLLNSPATHDATVKLLEKSPYHEKVRVFHLIQTIFPVCDDQNLKPIPDSTADLSGWYPTGSGEAFKLIIESPAYQRLKNEGKKYLFMSNIENLGRAIEPKILNYFATSQSSACLEVTDRLSVDSYGGILVQHQNTNEIGIIEVNQIPYQMRDNFSAIDYPYYNTNNIWVKLDALEACFRDKEPETNLHIKAAYVGKVRGLRIENPASQTVFAMDDVRILVVPRSRYVKIVNTEDLLAIQSNIYNLEHGVIQMNKARVPATTPMIKLGDAVSKQYFKLIHEYQKRIKSIPNCLELEHLTISGDVTLGANVTLKGTVIIVAEKGSRIDIPNGTTLENKIVTGQLQILKY